MPTDNKEMDGLSLYLIHGMWSKSIYITTVVTCGLVILVVNDKKI